MKYLSILFLVFLVIGLQAQTKLINHKSHSGTNETFKPKQVEGNFGLVEINEEIEPNKDSNYKLAYHKMSGGIQTFYLFYTTRGENSNVCMKDDRIIEQVTFSQYPMDIGEDNKIIVEENIDEFHKAIDETKERLIKRLNEFRDSEVGKKELQLPG